MDIPVAQNFKFETVHSNHYIITASLPMTTSNLRYVKSETYVHISVGGQIIKMFTSDLDRHFGVISLTSQEVYQEK